MSTPLVEGIIFDLDGTLIDYEGASHTALSRPLERRGKSFSWELHATIVGTKPEDWSENIIAAHELADVLPPAEYAAEYFDEVAGLYADIPAWPGTLSLLTALSTAGFPMAIATSSPRQSFEKKMMHHAGILTKMVRLACCAIGDRACCSPSDPLLILLWFPWPGRGCHGRRGHAWEARTRHIPRGGAAAGVRPHSMRRL